MHNSNAKQSDRYHGAVQLSVCYRLFPIQTKMSICLLASICGSIGGRLDDPTIYTRGTVYNSGVQKQGTAPSTRFHYDPASGRCIPFTYLGAGGNFNNFLR